MAAGNFKESAFLTYEVFRELANHQMNLATRLQGLVPTNKAGGSGSAQYLHDNSLMLKELSEKVKALMLQESSPRSSTVSSSGQAR